MSIPAFQRIINLRAQFANTIQCPCCGSDTYVPFVREGVKATEAQIALRERMRRAGLTLKAVRLWTTAR